MFAHSVHMYVSMCETFGQQPYNTHTYNFNVLNSRTLPHEVMHNPYTNLEIFQTSLEPHHII